MFIQKRMRWKKRCGVAIRAHACDEYEIEIEKKNSEKLEKNTQ
jgi:hypothetical protein